MKKSLKLLITSIITILMIVSSIPITAFAAESIANAKVTIKYSAYTYTGKAITPDITVTLNGETLTKGADYTVNYTNNIKVGKEATITIKGIKKYNGTVTKTFIIKPAKNKVVSYYTTNTGHFTLNWEKGTNGTVGYQILYSQDKELLKSATGEMKNDDETKYVHSYTTTNLTANFTSKTQANKTYYVKVRSFYTKDGTTTSTRYGNYSDVVEIHTTNDKTFTRGIGGATGWAAAPFNSNNSDIACDNNKNKTSKIYKAAKTTADTVGTIKNGEKFTIICESSNFLKIKYGKVTGYIEKSNCFINLKDIEPEIYVDIKNTYSSIFTTGNGKSIKDLYNVNLYNWGGNTSNKKSASASYIALNYDMAKKVALAQQYASNDGYSLKIYDAYRPVDVAKNFNTIFDRLVGVGSTSNIFAGGSRYSKAWFISAPSNTRVSAHCTGSAIDVTLVYKNTGNELTMPTKMHELSNYACDTYLNNNAIKLKNYCTNAGLQYLESEWWHFQLDINRNNRQSTSCQQAKLARSFALN